MSDKWREQVEGHAEEKSSFLGFQIVEQTNPNDHSLFQRMNADFLRDPIHAS